MAELTHKLWPIVKREYLERVRSRWFLIATVFAPLLFAGLIIIPARLSRQGPATTALYSITVIDATTTGIGAYVARHMDGGTYGGTTVPIVRVVPADSLPAAEREATRDVMQRRASGYVVLDSGVIYGLNARYAGRRDDARADMQALAAAVRAGLIDWRLARHGLTDAQIDSVTVAAPTVQTEHIGDQGHSRLDPFKIVLATFVAFFLYMSIVLFGQSMLSGVLEEKMTRVSEVVLSSVRPGTLLAGKVIGVSAVGLTQQLLWILGAAGLLWIRTATGTATESSNTLVGVMAAVHAVSVGWLALVVLFFVLGFVFFGSLYAAVGAMVNSESEARQAAQPVILLLVTTAVMIQPVISNPSSTLARTLSILPFSAPILMPLRMAISTVPALEVIASIVAVIIGCVGAVWLAARIYRVALLMYGKRPTLRELGRWIRAR